ncbi:unnamed protein product [Malus baccata var. baccata]
MTILPKRSFYHLDLTVYDEAKVAIVKSWRKCDIGREMCNCGIEACSGRDLTAIHGILENIGYKDDGLTNEVFIGVGTMVSPTIFARHSLSYLMSDKASGSYKRCNASTTLKEVLCLNPEGAKQLDRSENLGHSTRCLVCHFSRFGSQLMYPSIDHKV